MIITTILRCISGMATGFMSTLVISAYFTGRISIKKTFIYPVRVVVGMLASLWLLFYTAYTELWAVQKEMFNSSFINLPYFIDYKAEFPIASIIDDKIWSIVHYFQPDAPPIRCTSSKRTKIECGNLINYWKISTKIKDKKAENNECIICMINEKVVTLVPCGHTYCMTCTKKLINECGQKCSLCKIHINDVIKFYK